MAIKDIHGNTINAMRRAFSNGRINYYNAKHFFQFVPQTGDVYVYDAIPGNPHEYHNGKLLLNLKHN